MIKNIKYKNTEHFSEISVIARFQKPTLCNKLEPEKDTVYIQYSFNDDESEKKATHLQREYQVQFDIKGTCRRDRDLI